MGGGGGLYEGLLMSLTFLYFSTKKRKKKLFQTIEQCFCFKAQWVLMEAKGWRICDICLIGEKGTGDFIKWFK